MLTTTAVTALVALSGGEASRYSWSGVPGCSRFDNGGQRTSAGNRLGSRRQGARLFLFRAQSGLCPDCGEALDESAEFCHVVSRGLDADHSDEGKGWVAGNLFLGHRTCNKAQQARGPVVWPETLSRPDVIPSAEEWPSTPVLRALAPKN